MVEMEVSLTTLVPDICSITSDWAAPTGAGRRFRLSITMVSSDGAELRQLGGDTITAYELEVRTSGNSTFTEDIDAGNTRHIRSSRCRATEH